MPVTEPTGDLLWHAPDKKERLKKEATPNIGHIPETSRVHAKHIPKHVPKKSPPTSRVLRFLRASCASGLLRVLRRTSRGRLAQQARLAGIAPQLEAHRRIGPRHHLPGGRTRDEVRLLRIKAQEATNTGFFR